MWKDGDKGAILQKDKESLAVVPHTPCGIVTPEILRTIADTAEKFNVDSMKITGAARIALIGISQDEVDDVWESLGTAHGAAIGNVIRSVKACPGTQCCKKGLRDSIGMGMYLDDKYHNVEVTGKMKLGVSGCPMQCAENCIKDISLTATRDGWNLMVGGNGGARPRYSEVIATKLTDDEAKYFVDRCVVFFKDNAKKGERMSRLLDRVGKISLGEYVFADRSPESGEISEGWFVKEDTPEYSSVKEW